MIHNMLGAFKSGHNSNSGRLLLDFQDRSNQPLRVVMTKKADGEVAY